MKERFTSIAAYCVWFFVSIAVFSSLISVLTSYPITTPSKDQSHKIQLSVIASSHPYCAIDPTCIDVVDGNAEPYLSHLPSVVYTRLPESNNVLAKRNFAVPNYLFFVLLLSTLATLAVLFVHPKWIFIGLLVSVSAWCVEEIGRWTSGMNLVGISGDVQTVALLSFSLGVISLGPVMLLRSKYRVKDA